MRTGKLSTGTLLGLGLTAALFGSTAVAAISGKTDLICASVNVVACADSNCLQGQAQTFDMPTFFWVDVKRKLMHGRDEDSKEISSPIKNWEVTDNAVILQGLENHRGWTAGIDRKNGELTLSSTGAEVSFIIFGNCTER